MVNFNAKFTNDGSVGLYSEQIGDIYHSIYGALSEAYEKFIFPANLDEFLNTHDEIKILDLCYGLGYNSKSFLNFYFNIYSKKNNFIPHLNNYIDSIYTNNICNKIFHKITLHGVDIDKNLLKLSPLISHKKKFINTKKNMNIFSKKNLFNSRKFFIKDYINIFIFLNLLELYKKNYIDKDLHEILANNSNKKFFTLNLAYLIKKFDLEGYELSQHECLLALLHNIYYKYISNSYKNALKLFKNENIKFRLYNQDARSFIKSTDLTYDYIFLDAFSPTKAPNLWTAEFFGNLYNHLSDDGMILTYSNSASIRNAFLKNNFYIGKIFNKYENRFTGTIATKNESLIKHKLDNFEIGLLNTKAGICYHDNAELTLDDKTILLNRKIECENSNLISSTKYKKEYKCSMML